MVFVGWVLSAFSFVIALAGLATPGAGKLISLALIGWCLIFLPPLWRRTIKYGLPVNIVVRVVAFFTLPVIFVAMATANEYHSPPVADSSQKKPDKEPATASKQPVKEVTPKAIEKVTPEPEQPVKTVAPKPTQCELDILVVRDINRMRDANSSVKSLINGENIHRNIYPAFKSCGSIDEFVAEASKYPESTNKANPKTYLANICSTSETLDMGICKEVPDYLGMKTTYFLALRIGSIEPTPVSDENTMRDIIDAFKERDLARYIKIMTTHQVSRVEGERVDILGHSGELVQVKLHTVDTDGKDLEGKVLWTWAKFVQTDYEYVK
jgi:CBS domain-containing protein